jgi:hypothetical protein
MTTDRVAMMRMMRGNSVNGEVVKDASAEVELTMLTNLGDDWSTLANVDVSGAAPDVTALALEALGVPSLLPAINLRVGRPVAAILAGLTSVRLRKESLNGRDVGILATLTGLGGVAEIAVESGEKEMIDIAGRDVAMWVNRIVADQLVRVGATDGSILTFLRGEDRKSEGGYVYHDVRVGNRTPGHRKELPATLTAEQAYRLLNSKE